MVVLQLPLTPELHAELEEAARKEGVSLPEFCIGILEDAVDDDEEN